MALHKFSHETTPPIHATPCWFDYFGITKLSKPIVPTRIYRKHDFPNAFRLIQLFFTYFATNNNCGLEAFGRIIIARM
jgi:hypothetical protein